MYAVGEVIEAKFLLLNPSTGIVVTGASVSATVYDEADAEYSTPEVTEIGAGLYTASFTPDAAGEWTILFSCVDPNQTGGLCFPVGKGVVQDVEDKVDIVDANVDSVLADTNELQTDWANGGRLDLLIDAIKVEAEKISNVTYGLSALKTLIDTVDSVADAIKLKTDLLFAVSSSSVSHDITTANDTVETVIEEIEDTNNYSLSLFFDLDTLKSASEGEVVTIKLYNKIDGSNYSDSPIAVSEYVVGSEIEYPSIETNVLSGYSKITISCSGEVTATRSIVCRILKRNM